MKKITSLILVAFILSGLFSFNVIATDTENTTSVYVSASMYGEFLVDKNGEKTICREIEIIGNESCTLDEVFIAFHDSFFEGMSEEGYATATGNYGKYITKFCSSAIGIDFCRI